MSGRDPHADRRLLLAAHGTRNAEGRACVESIRAALEEYEGRPVTLGWVDVCEPYVADLVQDADLVVPCFLGDGYHVRVDIPRAARRADDVHVTPHLGPDPLVLDALADRVTEAGGPWLVTLLGWAGSSDERSVAQARGVAERLAARWGVEVRLVTPRQAAGAVEDAAARGLSCGVATYLLAPGHFSRQLASHGVPASAPLGAHPAVIQALSDRIRHDA